MSPVSPVLPGRFFTTEPPEKPHFILWVYHNMFNGSLIDGHLAFSQYFIKNTTMNKFLSQSICAFIVFIGQSNFLPHRLHWVRMLVAQDGCKFFTTPTIKRQFISPAFGSVNCFCPLECCRSNTVSFLKLGLRDLQLFLS